MAFNQATKSSVSATILLTSRNESSLSRAVQAILSQVTKHHSFLIVSPEQPPKHLLTSKVRWFKDKGGGKSAAINEVLPHISSDIIIFTDGDVTILPNALNEILEPFANPKVGCVSGRVMSANSKDSMLGFWSHLLADAGAHNIRKEGAKKNKFLECTGYLFACRNHVIRKIPLDVAEDAFIPYVFKMKGYDIAYAEHAKVLVKNPTTFHDWIAQRKRTAKAHETLGRYADTKKIPRVKSWQNEMSRGIWWALSYPKTLQQCWWTIMLFLARMYMWMTVWYETKIIKEQYRDNWARIKTAR